MHTCRLILPSIHLKEERFLFFSYADEIKLNGQSSVVVLCGNVCRLKFVDLFLVFFFLPRQCLRLQMDATLHNVCVSVETQKIFFVCVKELISFFFLNESCFYISPLGNEWSGFF